MQIEGGSVDISTMIIKNASSQFLVIDSAHSGTISDLTIDTNNSHDLSFINMASGVTTTFNNVFIKGDFQHSGTKNVLIDRNNDTNITIPDLLIKSGDTLTLSSNITLPSNLIVQNGGILSVNGKTIDKESYATGNITINTGSSSVQSTTFDSCGLIKLTSLDTNSVMDTLTLNNCTGMQVEGGSVDISTMIIKNASSQFLVIDSAHSGTISNLTIDTNNSHDLSFINMASGVTTEFSNVFIKGDFQHSGTKSTLIDRNNDTNITIPDLLIKSGDTLTLSSNITLPSNLTVQSGGILSVNGKTIDKESYASGNITINTGSSSVQSTTFDSCGLIKLSSLDTNSVMSSLTLNNCTGMQVEGGSVDISTMIIKNASSQFLVIDSSHSGTISDFTIDTNNSHDLSFINMASGVTTSFSNVFIKGDFQHSGTKNVLIDRNNDTNITIPDLLIKSGDTLTLSSNITLPSNLTVQSGGILIVNGKTLDKESYATGNITINTGSSSVQSTTFDSCGLIKLSSLDTNSVMDTLTLNNCTGMQIEGGSVDISTMIIKNASSQFLVIDSAHSGTISDLTIDTNNSHDLSFINIASGVTTTFSNVFIKGDFQHSGTKSVLIDRNSDVNITIPDLLIKSGDTLTLSSNLTLPSNLTVQSGGILSVNGKTIDKESYASGNITINTGSSSIETTTFR